MAQFPVTFLSDEQLLEVAERLRKLRGVRLEDLPLAALRRWLEQNWRVTGSELLLPSSVTSDEMVMDVRDAVLAAGIGEVAFPSDALFLVRQGNPATTPFYLEVTAGAANQVWSVTGRVICRGASAAWAFLHGEIVMTSSANETVIATGRRSYHNVHNSLNWVDLHPGPSKFTVPAGTTRRFHFAAFKYSSIGVGANYYNTGAEDGPWIQGWRLS